ncbi:MAG: hypothetical protein IJI58_03460 [Bacilli bacterium]|nr:hypothetical protein [Bacilli bacterium]
MDNKEDLDKLDKQINKLLNKDEEEKEQELDEEREIIIDRKHEYDDTDGETKVLDKIEDIEEKEEDEEELVEEEPKKSRVERLEEQEESIEEDKETRVERLEEQEEEEELEKKSKKKKIIIICSVIGVLLLIGLILFLVLHKGRSVDTDSKKKFSKSEQKEIIEDYGDELKSIINNYYDQQKVLLSYDDANKLIDFDYKVNCKEHEIYDDREIYLNKCTINKVSTSYSYGKKQTEKPKQTDDKIKVYVSKDTEKASLDEPKDISKYDVYGFNIDGEYSNLNLLNEKNSDYVYYEDGNHNLHMINYKTGLKALNPLKYDIILPIRNGEEYDPSYVAIMIGYKVGIYNLDTRERTVNHIYTGIYQNNSDTVRYVQAVDLDKVKVYTETNEGGIINYKTGKVIVPVVYNPLLTSGSYFIAVDKNNKTHILDSNNKEYFTQYDDVYGIADDKYVLVKEDDNIELIKPNGTLIYNYGKVELGVFDSFVIFGDTIKFVFKNEGDTCTSLSYDTKTKKGELNKNYECLIMVDKPILYLYPEKTTNITVTFEHPEYLKTTYPKYNGKWEVKAKKNGDLIDKNNKKYYALYWDEKKVHTVDFSTGYYVTKDNAIDFLESKLDYIGLNYKEKNEFIMYWLPRLENNDKSLVYFELTDERESYNKLNIEPKPDSMLRLVIHIKKVSKKVDIPEQKLTKFKRHGFSAVEWGGTTY